MIPDIYSTLIKELHKFAKNRQYQHCVLGLSGGLDSTVALCVAVRAFGGKNVTALIMPEIGLTPNEDIEHAKGLADYFGCQSHYQPINNFLVDYSFVTWEKSELATENLKARSRSSLLRHFAESQNALFIGGANKSDLLLGYGSLEGEFAGDLHIFGDCYKTDIMEIAKTLELPREILEKSPSRHLKPRQSDMEDLGAPWSKIDDALKQIIEGADPETLIEKGMDSLMVHRVSRLIQQNRNRFDKLPMVKLGRMTESIKKAQAAEASST